MEKKLLFVCVNSILLFGNVCSMDFQDLKKEFEREFFNIQSNPSEKTASIEDITTAEDFLTLVQQNNIAMVKQCLKNQQFKDMIDAPTLVAAYQHVKNSNSLDLQYGIYAVLQHLFPAHRSTITKEEQSDFQAALTKNTLDKYLDNHEFLVRTPIYILRTAQSQLRNKGDSDRSNKIRAIIQRKRAWLQNK